MNHGWNYRAQLDSRDAGRSLVEVLAARWPHSDAATWRERMESGEIRLDGHPTTLERSVVAGQWLEWSRPPWEEPAVPLDFGVIAEDEQLVVVDKPGGLPTMPAGGFLEHTLLAQVRRLWPDASPMHRLGRGTSGLVVFARTAAARSALQRAWREQRVEKTYRTLVNGVPPSQWTTTAPIGPVAHPRLGKVFSASERGKSAVSHFRRIAADDRGSLVDVDIDTGRPHQIRIHAAFSGHPLVGDPLYGAGGVPRSDALPGDLGYTLHAWKIRFIHPNTGEPIGFEAPLPEALAADGRGGEP